MKPGPIFVTGASGVVGQALLKKLSGHELLGLTHRAPVDAPGFRALHGDMLEPRLGLSVSAYDEVAASIRCVVHAAAATNFGQPDQVVFRANVEGTRNVVDLAASAGVPLYHVSTAFVMLCDPSQAGSRPNAYARSKAEAELIVRQSGVRAVIVRPSRIIGDSRTGAISKFQGFHLLFDLMARGELRHAPGSAAALVDFVPQDVVANALAGLIRAGCTQGEYWLTAGATALTLDRTIELCREHIARLTGRSIGRPERIDRIDFDARIKPGLLASTPAELWPLVEGVLQMMDSLNLAAFPTSLADPGRGSTIGSLPEPEVTLIRNLQFWARRRGLTQATSVMRSAAGRQPSL